MKRCIQEHTVDAFGTIPVGSLWADDSPYLSDDTADLFEPVDDTPAVTAKKKPTRKFGEHTPTEETP
jgi:hypothetical protein